MRQRFHSGLDNDGGNGRIAAGIEFVGMGAEEALDRLGDPPAGIHGLGQPPDPRHLLVQDLVQGWIDPVRHHASLDKGANPVRDGRGRRIVERRLDDPHDFVGVSLNQRGHQRFLVGEVLVERADADAGAFGNAAGRRPFVSPLDQNVSRRRDDLRPR